ncbi:unnamed protein product [Oikopleura dioica]|uniref:Uncharacterized protein n=1 Tax=Oikopleura dioica TaxID=34765 RepID=E4YQ53_OIKDI|nr:unnamed protein product [Oikopleura dioica]
MGQLVKDNSITRNTFKIILESTSPSSNPDSINLSPHSNRLSTNLHSPFIASLLTGSVTRDSSFAGLKAATRLLNDGKLVNLQLKKYVFLITTAFNSASVSFRKWPRLTILCGLFPFLVLDKESFRNKLNSSRHAGRKRS